MDPVTLIVAGITLVLGLSPSLVSWWRHGGAPKREELRALGAELARFLTATVPQLSRLQAWPLFTTLLTDTLVALGWKQTATALHEATIGALPIFLDLGAAAAERTAVRIGEQPPPDPRVTLVSVDPDGTRHITFTPHPRPATGGV